MKPIVLSVIAISSFYCYFSREASGKLNKEKYPTPHTFFCLGPVWYLQTVVKESPWQKQNIKSRNIVKVCHGTAKIPLYFVTTFNYTLMSYRQNCCLPPEETNPLDWLKKKERKMIRIKLARKLFVVFIFHKTGYRPRATMGLRLRIHPQFLKNSYFTCSTILCKINLRTKRSSTMEEFLTHSFVCVLSSSYRLTWKLKS